MVDYPVSVYKNKKSWLRDVRKKWIRFRKHWWKARDWGDKSIWCGRAYYPPEVYKWLDQFGKMDKLMREYYKKA